MKTKLSFSMLFAMLFFASCADKDYSISNLDMTIGLGNEEGLALPGNNSVSDIKMADIITLEDNDIITINDEGNYVITRFQGEDDIDPSQPVIDEITMTVLSDETTSVDYDYDINEITEEVRRNFIAGAASNALSPTAKEIYHFAFSNLSEIADVLHISMAGLQAGINLSFNYSEDLKNNIENLKAIRLDLPNYFDIDVRALGNNVNNIHFDKSENRLDIQNPTKESIVLYLKLNGLRFTDGQPDQYGYSAYFSPDSSSFIGGIILDVDYQDNAAHTRRMAPQADSEDLTIHCKTVMEKEVVITEATGHFKPEIDLGEGIGDFTIDNLPDFLEDDEAHLTLDNPELRLWVNSNMDIRGKIESASIKTYTSSGKEVVIDVDTESSPLFIDPHTGTETGDNGELLPSTTTAIIISDKPATHAPAPHTYYGTVKEGLKLGDIFYDIPNKVSFDLRVVADSTYEGFVKLGYKDAETKEPWYTIQPSYEFYAPLALDAGSIIVFRDSITGWHQDLSNVRLSDGSYITITANVYNRIPLDLKLHAKAIELVEGQDSLWRDMSSSLIDVVVTDDNGNDVRIKAGDMDNPTVTQVKIVMSQKDPQAFKRIDGLAYSATAIASEDDDKQGIILNQQHKLKIDNIGVMLHGKIILDLNEDEEK